MIRGFDTETYEGEVKLLAFSDTDNKSGYIETNNTVELLDFLYENGKDSQYNVFYNLSFDVSVILKEYINKDAPEIRGGFYKYLKLYHEYKSLSEEMETKHLNPAGQRRFIELKKELTGFKPLNFKINNYNVSVISGKSFSIKRNNGGHRKTVYFFDCANFYMTSHDGFMTLDYASQKYLNDKKNNTELSIDREKIGDEAGYYDKHRNDIITYCKKDCYLTAKLFEKTIKGFKNLNLTFPLKPYSKASVSRQWLKDNKNIMYNKSQQVYKHFSLIEKFQKYYSGGIFNTFSIGHFKGNIIYRDINSAYPYAISHLYSLEGARLEDKVTDKCDYAFYKIKTKHTSLLQTRIKNKIYYIDDDEEGIYFITGMDKQTLDLFHVEYSIEKEIGVITTHKKILPEIAGIYKQKSDIKKIYGSDSVEYANVKITMNGLYGVLAQSKPAITDYTNFIYASYITATCRNIIMAEYHNIINNGDKPLQIATDSIMFMKNSDVDYPDSKELGSFGNEYFDDVVIFGNGIYIFKPRGETKYQERRRGFSKLSLEGLNTDASSFINITRQRPVKIMEGLIQRKTDGIGKFQKETKQFYPVKSISHGKDISNIEDWGLIDFFYNHVDLKTYQFKDINTKVYI
jgi:hypothetical protein